MVLKYNYITFFAFNINTSVVRSATVFTMQN